jgi:hypothetical protein
MRTSLPRPIEPVETTRNSNNSSIYVGERETRNIYLNCYPYNITGGLPSPMSFSTAVASTPPASKLLKTSPFDSLQEPRYSLSPSSLREKSKRDDLTVDEEGDGGSEKFDPERSSLLVKSSLSSSAARKKRVSILTTSQTTTPTLSSSSSTLSSSSSASKGYNNHAQYQSLYPVVTSPTTTEAVTTACWEFNFSFLPRMPSSIKLKNVMHGLKRVASSSSTPRRHHRGGDVHEGNGGGVLIGQNNNNVLSGEELSSTIVAQCDDHDDHVEILTAETVERETRTAVTTAIASTSTTSLTPSKTIDIVYQRSRLLLQHENEVSCVTAVAEENHNRHYRISWKANLCEYNDGSAWDLREQERRTKHQRPQQPEPSTAAESFVSFFQFVAKDYSLHDSQQQQSATAMTTLTSPMNHARRPHVPLVARPRVPPPRRLHHHHHGLRYSHQRRRRDPQWRAAQVEKANQKWRMNLRGNI